MGSKVYDENKSVFFSGAGQNWLFFLDLILVLLAFLFAFQLKLGINLGKTTFGTFFTFLPAVLVSRSIFFFKFGLYSRFWKNASLEDLGQILKSAAAGSLTIVILFSMGWVILDKPFMFSILVIDFLLVITFQGGSRLLWRMFKENVKRVAMESKCDAINIFIYGAGEAGASILENFKKQMNLYRVVGFIDDDPMKKNKIFQGVKVLGDRYDISGLAKKNNVREVVISANNISPDRMTEIVEICQKGGLSYKRIHSFTDSSTNEIHISQVKNIDIGDLLGREPVSLDLTMIKKLIKHKKVLVTGAGGSIGSELSSQVLEFDPQSLIMIDSCENYLFDLRTNLNSYAVDKMHFIFGSITNRKKMETIFSTYRPQLIFHTAAHKHVPLMEENVDEAIYNNVFGTKLVADLASRFGAEKFVFVSTDKVVRPTSIMGKTKRIAEHYIQHIREKSSTRFMIVRFGNVIGSKGSVVPLFKKQIESGGPVTVTHPDMQRYFMLISEAVQLILQAAAFEDVGHVFLLDMGKPVKILDLAKKMIRISRTKSRVDIPIEFTGIRPGENLYEELILNEDVVRDTYHEKIKVIETKGGFNANFDFLIEQLISLSGGNDLKKFKQIMLEMIPETSSASFPFEKDNV